MKTILDVCVELRVPGTGSDVYDKKIIEARRIEIATAIMASLCALGRCEAGTRKDDAEYALKRADALMAEMGWLSPAYAGWDISEEE